ncbi:MAG: restriction endonuclease subunit S [Candidatus Cloacimonetes bacterium]|nr:restriction endonuclease subunit S [Candidatus Cloacimonadota bacterium]
MECFCVNSQEIENRIDPHFYRPEFIEFYEKLEKSKFKTIGEISEKVTSGATPLSKGDSYTTQKEGIPFIRSGDINEDKSINFDEVLYIKKDIHEKKLKGSKLKKGDLLIAIVGATIGQVSIYDYDREANINQAIALVRLNEEVNSEYVKAFMISTLGQKQLVRIKRPVARANINLDEIRSIKIILPTLEIQNHIVKIIDNAYKIKKQKEKETQQLLDSFEDLLHKEKILNLKRTQQQKIFSINLEDLDGALNPERYANQIQYDSSVDWIQINKIGDVCRNTFDPEKSNPEDTYSLMRIDDLANNPISAVTRNVKGKDVNGIVLKVQTNDVLIARLGPSIENKKFILAPKSSFKLISSNEFICLRCYEKNNPYFALHLLRTDFYNNLMIQKTRGATPSRRRLSHEDFSELPIPKIDIKIQNKIADEVKKRMQKVEQLQKEAKELLEQAKDKIEQIILKN